LLSEKAIPKYTGSMQHFAGLKHYRFIGGLADDVEAIDVRTGAGFNFTVLPGRGMDIAYAYYNDIPISYSSKTGIVGAPYYEYEGMNWIRSFFGGLVTTCGLSNVGPPCIEEHETIGTIRHGLHGRISNIPADHLCLKEGWENGAYHMVISGSCHEGCLHAESRTLVREISAEYGAAKLEINDRIRNDAPCQDEIMLLYHINIGYPIVNETTRFIASVRESNPIGVLAGKERYDIFASPVPEYSERCYLLDLNTDHDGFVHFGIVNDSIGIGFALSYNKAALPYFNLWKMLKEGEYVVGLEPCTCPPIGRIQAKQENRLETLLSCETKTTNMIFTILCSKREIADFEKKVRSLHDEKGRQNEL